MLFDVIQPSYEPPTPERAAEIETMPYSGSRRWRRRPLPRNKTMPDDPLPAIEAHFHALIAKRAEEFGCEQPKELPKLREAAQTDDEPAWFPVPGMYGGFSFKLQGDGAGAKLICESWSRVCGGSGQRHEISIGGAVLVEEGFV